MLNDLPFDPNNYGQQVGDQFKNWRREIAASFDLSVTGTRLPAIGSASLVEEDVFVRVLHFVQIEDWLYDNGEI